MVAAGLHLNIGPGPLTEPVNQRRHGAPFGHDIADLHGPALVPCNPRPGFRPELFAISDHHIHFGHGTEAPGFGLRRTACHDQPRLGVFAADAADLLARLPHQYDSFLSYGHTIPTGDPPVPYADDTELCCALILVPLMIAVALAVYALQFFAIPRVMLEGAEPMAAMKQSFRDCLANIGAYLVFVGVLMLGFIVLAVVLSVLSFLGSLLVSTVLVPTVACGLYLAWQQVGAGAAAAEPPAQA